MRLGAIVALALVSSEVTAGGRIPPRGVSLPRGCRDRSCVRERAVDSTGEFNLVHSYGFGAVAGNPPTLPTFAGDSNLKYLCKVSATPNWQCYINDSGGTASGTMTQGVSPTWRTQTPWGIGAATDLTDAKAPVLSNETVPSGLWENNYTVIWFGYGTTKVAATETFFMMSNTNDGIRARFSGGTLTCTFFETVATEDATVSGWSDGWNFGACARNGTSHYAQAAGTRGVAVVDTNAMVEAGSTTMRFGRDSSDGVPLGGPLGWVAIYDHFKTTAQVTAIGRAALGFPTDPAVAINGAPAACYEVDGGTADCMAGFAFVGPLGYRATKGGSTTSKWAADPLAVGTWIDVGTPVVADDVMGGPFYQWKLQNECDRMVDDSAAAFEGKVSANGYVRDSQAYSASLYLATGDAGTTVNKARILLTTDGAFSDGGTLAACDFADLTPTPTLKTCSAVLLAGSSVTGSILVGNAVADTGSITICHARLNASYQPEEPVLTNSAIGNSTSVTDVTGWQSVALGGKYEVCWAPQSSGNVPEWGNSTDTIYLHDAAAGGGGHLVTYLYGYTTAGRFLYETSAGGSGTDTTLDGVTLTPNTVYCSSVEWVPTGAGTCSTAARWDAWSGTGMLSDFRATTIRASATAAECPGQPAEVYVPQRYDLSVPTSAWILSVRNYRLD